MNPALLPFEPGSYHSQDLTRHRRRAMASQQSDQANARTVGGIAAAAGGPVSRHALS